MTIPTPKCTCISEGSSHCKYPHPCRGCGRAKHYGVSCYWNNQGKTPSDKKPGRTFNGSDGSLWCDECCNGDRCDDPTHYNRDNCPFCLGSGTNEWQRMVFLAPAPAIPEAICDLLHPEGSVSYGVAEHNAAVIEAYRRGMESK